MSREKFKKQKWFDSQALFFIFLSFLSACSRWSQNKKKPDYKYFISVALPEDYLRTTDSLKKLILSKVPEAQIHLRENLSSQYEFAPFDDWVLKSDKDLFMQLSLTMNSVEDQKQVALFVKTHESQIPFKLPLLVADQSSALVNNAGAASLFCSARSTGHDLYERELCKALIASVCNTESRVKLHRGERAPLCQLSIQGLTPVSHSSASEQGALEFDNRKLVLSSFPLPLKVKSDYPLSRIDDVDVELLAELFQRE